MMRFIPFLGAAMLGGVLAVSLMLVIAPAPARQVAVVDLNRMLEAYTLSLAASDLSEDEIARQVQAWAEARIKQLETIAETYHLVIIPSELGVWGAPNITRLIESRLNKEGGRDEQK